MSERLANESKPAKQTLLKAAKMFMSYHNVKNSLLIHQILIRLITLSFYMSNYFI